MTGCEIIIFFFMTVWSRSYDLEFVTVCTERGCFQMTSGYVLRFGPIKSAFKLQTKQSFMCFHSRKRSLCFSEALRVVLHWMIKTVL